MVIRLNILRPEASKRLTALKELQVKGRRCLNIDLQEQQVRLRLHWLIHGVTDNDVRMALVAFGKITEPHRGGLVAKRFGHVDAECVRSYGKVTGSTEAADATEHIMDVTEAEDTAEAFGDEVAAQLNCSSATPVEEPTPAPGDIRPGSAGVSTETADNTVTDASCEVTGASASALKQGQVVDGASCNVDFDMKTDGDARSASCISGTSGAIPAIQKPFEEPGKMGDRNSASSVEEPPAKEPTARRTSIRSRACGIVVEKAVNKSLPLFSETGRSGGHGGV
ncbi:hypothetical protein HPB51_009640 [Rhipicephalus microplus]|uniref:Uncharacterized protein n=1 Tax=Rhipicephalus microplus TaxID=6941 RepID=A0A9J6D986_RHIMP|nr:hypothetical protein HPB51_009640 [Rhipicephalus microplus]